MHIIITGGIQSGKSTMAAELLAFLKEKKIAAAGILAPGLWRNNQRRGFDLIDLKNGKKYRLARRRTDLNETDLTPFEFFPEGMKAGTRALTRVNCRKASVIMVDEVGRLELSNSGWAGSLKSLLTLTDALHIWIVREKLVAEVCEKWRLQSVKTLNVEDKNSFTQLKNLCLNFTINLNP
jgi:iron complex transport system ATP-binding protein